MCRIAGFWDFRYKGDYVIDKVLTTMRDTLTYGGPDDAGNYIDYEKGLALANRRLSIIDLSALGHQPMSDEDNNLYITYNGEVYNYKEIKAELQSKGYKFKSYSDTEVILTAYKEWGLDCVQRFRGMWAFAIWDAKKQELILSRDRIGVKPLYWYYKDGLFMFSSELKALHKHPKFYKELQEIALSLYLQYGYIKAPYSIFKYTYKLKPGYFLIINKNGEIKNIKYWDVQDYFLKGVKEKEVWLKKTEEEVSQELEAVLVESFKLRLVADVPVGLFLSGGIDSSLLAALLQKEVAYPLKTFTIGFYEKAYNEAAWAKGVARYLGTEHSELYCTPKEAFNIITKLPDFYDEPFGDSSAIPTFLVSQLAKQKVKVSLSADGGDEQFFGYPRYWLVGDKIQKFKKLPFSHLLAKMFSLVNEDIAFSFYNNFKLLFPKWIRQNIKDKNVYTKFISILANDEITKQYEVSIKYFLDNELNDLGIMDTEEQLYRLQCDNKIGFLEKMMLIDLETYLPEDLLTKVDRATMSVSLEGREPFLDNKILEYSSCLPVALKYKNKTSKYILKKILYKHIPEKLVNRPKKGFGVPVFEWFKTDLKGLYLEYLNEDKIKKGGFFNPQKVNRLLEDYLHYRTVNADKLWFLFVFQMWSEKWL